MSKEQYLKQSQKGNREHFKKYALLLETAKQHGFDPIDAGKRILERRKLTTKKVLEKIAKFPENINLNFIPIHDFDCFYMPIPAKVPKGYKITGSISLAESLCILKHAIKYHVLGLTRREVAKIEKLEDEKTWERISKIP